MRASAAGCTAISATQAIVQSRAAAVVLAKFEISAGGPVAVATAKSSMIFLEADYLKLLQFSLQWLFGCADDAPMVLPW